MVKFLLMNIANQVPFSIQLVVSPGGNYVAAVFGTSFFSIFNSKDLQHKEDSSEDNSINEPPVATLRFSNHFCSSFCWNPFDENIFLTGSNNGVVKVNSITLTYHHCSFLSISIRVYKR